MTSSAITVPTSRSASAVGREHQRLGRNNQDGWSVVRGTELVVAVVTDGCSSESSSEVGARLGATFLAEWVYAALNRTPEISAKALAEAADAAVAVWINQVAALTSPPEANTQALVQNAFLFTWLCVVGRPLRGLAFGVGDGAILVDGEVQLLEAGPDNTPDYSAYRLPWLGGEPGRAVVHFDGPARRMAALTDGFLPLLSRDRHALDSLLSDPVVRRNPAHLQRRLNVLASAERFSDDSTLAALLWGGE